MEYRVAHATISHPFGGIESTDVLRGVGIELERQERTNERLSRGSFGHTKPNIGDKAKHIT